MYPIYLVLSETEAEAVGSALNRARIAEIALLRKQGRGDCLAERRIQALDRVRAQMEAATPPPPSADELRNLLEETLPYLGSIEGQTEETPRSTLVRKIQFATHSA